MPAPVVAEPSGNQILHLLDLGFSYRTAKMLAVALQRDGRDWHHVAHMLSRGCSRSLACKIIL